MSRSERVERVALVLILVVVGGAAGAASFTHVHDWTMDNSPAGTPDWFGWANAVISELVPIGALLTVRQRRRAGGTIRYPMFLLLSAVALSLSAQLAVAKPGPSGWLLSAVPALAFMGLSKLVLSGKPAGTSSDVPAVVAETVATQQFPALDVTQPDRPDTASDETSGTEEPEPVVPDTAPEPEPVVPVRHRQKRRPLAVTHRLAVDMLATPGTTREAVAEALGISDRRLRVVLNTA